MESKGFTLTLQETRNIHEFMKIPKIVLRASLTLQETRSIHDSMNIPKIELIS